MSENGWKRSLKTPGENYRLTKSWTENGVLHIEVENDSYWSWITPELMKAVEDKDWDLVNKLAGI